MAATNEQRPDSEAELSNDVLVRRAVERLRLLADDPEVAEARPDVAAIAAIQRCATTIETVAKAFELYADRACFEERRAPDGEDGARLLPALAKVTYREVWARVEAFASGLAHEALVAPGAFVGICGFGSVDWVVADFAALRLAAVSVPLQTNMSPGDLEQILREAEVSCLVCSVEQLDAVDAVLPQCPSVRSLVVIDVRDGDRAAVAELARRERAATSPRVLTIGAVEARGIERGIVPMTLPAARPDPDPLMSLVYTSGSTGTPKGAMLPESLLRELWQTGFSERLLRRMPELAQITVSYMPLNHAAGRMGIMAAVVRGGLTSFVAKSDMSTLFEDIRLARPTMLMLVPRVAATIFQHYQGELVRRAPRGADEAERERVSQAILSEMRGSFLGDRLLLAMIGTAPTPPEIVAFVKRCFDVPVIDVYGSTEAGPLTFDDRVDADLGLDWRLVDVPELGYRTTDAPFPRGELHLKSRFVVPGYYKNARATKQLFDEDGYLNTGDIVEQRGPDRLVWIDRAKNVLKLSQGEFVATSRLEGLFASRSPYVRQIYVYGNGLRSYLLAVVVPDVAAASAALRARGMEPDDQAIKALVRSDIDRIAREEHLRGHEVPRDFLLEREPFTVERGLLTDSNKQSRPRLQARYGERLEALYGAIERAQVEELYALEAGKGGGADASVAERVRRAMSVTLGLADLDLRQSEQSFIQLGGDSLSAVGLEALLHDVTGVRVPVGLLLDPTSSVRAVVEYVEGALAGNLARNVTFADVHGSGAKAVRAADLVIEKLLAPSEIESARAAEPPSALPPRAEVALLTGANGFLGRFLALELLERLGGERTKLYAIVRASSDSAAFERLASSYRSDPALAQRFEELARGGRLAVLAGDLMKPRLGLADGVYARLSREVDLVVHNGALVNHALGYEALFEPNVLGTVTAMRFALAGRVKSLSYVSTVGVMSGWSGPGRVVGEDEDVRALFREKPTESGYAAGYGASKWASEVLLRDAHEKLGLPVLVFRPSEIMAHSAYRGQVNVPDFFTRLLAGVVYTELAPRSFYADAVPVGARHYDGLPVDVVARAIAAPSVGRAGQAGGHATYNVVNPYDDDGISLDVVVHWVRTAGYPVRRVADYDAWFRLFHDRLTSLPEARRQHSPLAILDAWAAPEGAAPRPRLGSERLRERLAALDPSFAAFPHVSEALIHKTLDDLATLRVIDRPLRMTG